MTSKLTYTGFTLIELLAAISVFAIMSVMAYGGLSNVISNNASTGAALERVKNVQRATLVIARDFNQIVRRNIRDEFGNTSSYLNTSPLYAYDVLIEFTKSGWRNPSKILRSNLQRVAYRLDEKNLIRLSWPQLDRAQGAEPTERLILENVADMRFRYMDSGKQWHEQWPPLNTGAGNTSTVTLGAIEIIMELEDWGQINRIIKLSGA